MSSFLFSVPTYVRFGCGVSKQVGSFLQGMNVKRVFFVYDKGVKAAGLVEGITASMREANITFCEYDGVLANPPDYQVEEAAALAREFQTDALVALGGGSSIDTAKAVNILLTNPSPPSLYDGIDLVKNPVKPLIAIPTTAGTGSEVTVVSVVTDTKTTKKMTIFGQNVAPSVALVDPELTIGLPPAITASTGMDALTHSLESYISTMASPLTDALALEATRIICRSLLNAYQDGKDIEARSNMLMGSMIAGMCFTNTSLGLVHGMAHPMGAHCNVPHGVANAIALAYVMEFNIPSISPDKMVLLAQAMGINVQGKSHESIGSDVFLYIQKLSSDLQIPRIRDVNVPRELLATLAHEATYNELATQTNPRKPTEEQVLALYEKAW